MAASDAYSASGGWSGGSAALSPGGVLTNYYQKLQTKDPNSGSMTVAQPTQATTQPSSLARVASTSQGTTAQPTAAQPTQTVALPTIATVPTVAAVPVMSRAATTTAAPAATSAATPAATSSVPTGLTGGYAGAGLKKPVYASIDPRTIPRPTLKAPTSTVYTDENGFQLPIVFDPVAGVYKAAGQVTQPADQGSWANGVRYNIPDMPKAIAGMLEKANAAYRSQLADYSAQMVSYNAAVQQQTQANAAAQTQFQAAADARAAADAQRAADQAAAFNLSGQLQAPNTSAVDAAGVNDMSRVLSQYRSGRGGVDAASYAYAGQGALGTQQAVNQVNHDTAYANAFNQNYATFANALAAQQTASANASAQKLSFDIQGIQQAVALVDQQIGQLSQSAQTNVQTQLIPLKQKLADYQLAVQQYGVDSKQATDLAKTIFSIGGSLVAALV